MMIYSVMVVKEEEIQMKTITTPQKLIMVQNIYYYYLIVIIQCLKSMYHVCQEFAPGWRCGETLVRPAMVAVAD